MNLANFLQAVRGPVLLVTLGVLIEIDYAGMLPFSRTWPLFIIVFGFLKLIERLVAPPAPAYPPVPPGFQPPAVPPGFQPPPASGFQPPPPVNPYVPGGGPTQ